jgi:hypothetical protein
VKLRFKSRFPWAVAFSFSRAIQQPALEIWKGQEANVAAAQQALHHRALQSGFAPGRLLCRDGEEMTGNRHNNREGNSGDAGEPEPGPYRKRMHRDWRFG